MRFFLENYCSVKSTAPVLGDILAVIRENTIEHAALFLNDAEIFEKNSTTGFYSRFPDGKNSSLYKKISMT